MSANIAAIGLNQERILHRLVQPWYRLDTLILTPEYRYGWYGNLHRTQKHGFRLHHCDAHKGLRSTACGAHKMRFFLSYRCDDVTLCK